MERTEVRLQPLPRPVLVICMHVSRLDLESCAPPHEGRFESVATVWHGGEGQCSSDASSRWLMERGRSFGVRRILLQGLLQYLGGSATSW